MATKFDIQSHAMNIDEQTINQTRRQKERFMAKGDTKNQRVVRNWSTQDNLVNAIDSMAKGVKEATGLHCDRSKVLNALSELALEAKDRLETHQIVSQETLKDALAAAIKKRK